MYGISWLRLIAYGMKITLFDWLRVSSELYKSKLRHFQVSRLLFHVLGGSLRVVIIFVTGISVMYGESREVFDNV